MKRFFVVLLIFVQSISAWAQPPQSACAPGGYIIAYFNGVDNTFLQAGQSILLLHAAYGQDYRGERLLYRRFYNPTGKGLRDFAEVMRQKEAETPAFRNRWDLMWEIINGGTAIATAMTVANPALRIPIEQLRQQLVQQSRDAANAMIASAAPEAVVSDFVAQMTALVTERKKIVAVAHSQGNLFLNAVYDRVKPTLTTDSLRTVHVGVASNSVRGPYMTADIDLVIGALRSVLGSTLPATPPPLPLSALAADIKGHGFAEIYFNSRFEAYGVIRGYIDTALAAVQTPATNGASGLFTITSTWNGSGDVDLHVLEPNGKEVFYGALQGFSGALDTDNTVANGPEHYVASCEPAAIQEGVFAVGVKNFNGADGRTATVQLTTLDRVYPPVRVTLGSTNALMGVFSVKVSRNTATGAYVVVQQ